MVIKKTNSKEIKLSRPKKKEREREREREILTLYKI